MTDSATDIRSHVIIFCLFFALAICLRLWGIWNVSTTDEYNEVLEALRVGSGHLNYDRWFKRFYLYILAVVYGVGYVAGWLLDFFSNPMDFATKVVRNMEPLFIAARVVSATAGALTVALLYHIGRMYFSRRAAVIAALLLCFTDFHIYLSQQAKVDAVLGCLIVISLGIILKIAQSSDARPRDFFWCGVAMALAIQTKINAVALGVPFVLALWFGGAGIITTIKMGIVRYLPGFIIGFVIGNPAVVFAPLRYLRRLTGLGEVYTTAINVVPHETIGFLSYPIYFYRSLGAVVSLAAIAACLFVLFKPDHRRLILLAFILAFYLLMGASRNLIATYYLIPALPALYLLIGDGIEALLSRIADRRPDLPNLAQSGFALALILLLVMPAYISLKHEIALYGPNTRYLAKDWIEKHIPAGSKILMDSGKSINSFAPPIAENLTSIDRIRNEARRNVAEGVIVHGMVDQNALVYYDLLAATVPPLAYDITSTRFGLQVASIDDYQAEGFDYFVISAEMKQNRTSDWFTERNPAIAAFYRALDTDRRLRLAKVIEPDHTHLGDTFYIYRLEQI